MYTILHEYKLIQDIQNEYNNLINFYENTKRPSVLVAYYNINTQNSDHQEDLYSTYDQYHASDIKFDLYEFTPVNYLQPITNQSGEAEDLDGIRLEGSSTITTYTIERPKINDLVRIYYPVQSDEIFRVKDFTTSVSALHSNIPVNWYQLELEYAPIETTEHLNILNHYIYDFSEQKYQKYEDYIKFIKRIRNIQQIFDRLKDFYSNRYDLYKVGKYVPLILNELVGFIKKEQSFEYKRIFEFYKLPYGYLELFGFQFYYGDIDLFPSEDGGYKVYNLETNKIEDYQWEFDSYESGSIEELFYLGENLLENY